MRLIYGNNKRILLATIVYLLLSILFVAQSFASIKREQVVFIVDDSVSAWSNQDSHLIIDSLKMNLSMLPDHISAGVIRAGKSPELLSAPKHDWNLTALNNLTSGLRSNHKRPKKANIKNAISMAMSMTNELDDVKTTLVLVIASPIDIADEELIDDLIEGQFRLYIMALKEAALAEIWQETTTSTGGMYVACDGFSNLPHCLFEIYLAAFNPQLLEVSGATFKVDRVSTKVTVVTIEKPDEPLILVSPDNKRINIRAKKFPGKFKNTVKVEFFGSMAVIQIDQPKHGLWGLKGAKRRASYAITKSRQSIKVMLSRKNYMDSEELIIYAFLSRDGNVVRLFGKGDQVGFIAELLSADKTQVASSALSDNGKYPDTIKNDGIFSTSIFLKDREGPQILRVIARTEMLSRRVLDHITVKKGKWVKVLTPNKTIKINQSSELKIELADTGYFHQNTILVAEYNGQKIRFSPDPEYRFRFRSILPSVKEPGLQTLKISKKTTINSLVHDKQMVEIAFKLKKPASKTKIIMAIFAALMLLNVLVFGFWAFRKYKSGKQVIEEEVEAEEEEEEEVVEEKPIKKEKKITVEQQVQEEVVDNVGDRMDEIFAVHKEDTGKDTERPELDMSDLDNDSVSDFENTYDDPFATYGDNNENEKDLDQDLEKTGVELSKEDLENAKTDFDASEVISDKDDSLNKLSSQDLGEIFGTSDNNISNNAVEVKTEKENETEAEIKTGESKSEEKRESDKTQKEQSEDITKAEKDKKADRIATEDLDISSEYTNTDKNESDLNQVYVYENVDEPVLDEAQKQNVETTTDEAITDEADLVADKDVDAQLADLLAESAKAAKAAQNTEEALTDEIPETEEPDATIESAEIPETEEPDEIIESTETPETEEPDEIIESTEIPETEEPDEIIESTVAGLEDMVFSADDQLTEIQDYVGSKDEPMAEDTIIKGQMDDSVTNDITTIAKDKLDDEENLIFDNSKIQADEKIIVNENNKEEKKEAKKKESLQKQSKASFSEEEMMSMLESQEMFTNDDDE